MKSYPMQFVQCDIRPELTDESALQAKGLTAFQAKALAQRYQSSTLWSDTAYSVVVTPFNRENAPPCLAEGVHLTIRRHDKGVIDTRARLGQIMRSLLPGYHGFEAFPREENVMGSGFIYHLWVFESEPFFQTASSNGLRPMEQSRHYIESLGAMPVYSVLTYRSPGFVWALGLPFFKIVSLTDDLHQPLSSWRQIQAIKKELFGNTEAFQYHGSSPYAEFEGQFIVLDSPGASLKLGIALQGLERVCLTPDSSLENRFQL